MPGGNGSEIFWQRVAVKADAALAGTTLVPTVAVVPDVADQLGAVAVLDRDRRTRLARRKQPRAIR